MRDGCGLGGKTPCDAAQRVVERQWLGASGRFAIPGCAWLARLSVCGIAFLMVGVGVAVAREQISTAEEEHYAALGIHIIRESKPFKSGEQALEYCEGNGFVCSFEPEITLPAGEYDYVFTMGNIPVADNHVCTIRTIEGRRKESCEGSPVVLPGFTFVSYKMHNSTDANEEVFTKEIGWAYRPYEGEAERREERLGSGNPGEPNSGGCFGGKPVNCATGDEVQTQTDLSVGGTGPGLQLRLTYNSLLAVKQSTPGSFGYGWTSSYSAHLGLKDEGQEATVYQDNGSTVMFTRSGDEWTAPSGLVEATLASEGSGYVYTLPSQTKLHFNEAGQLTSEEDRNGNVVSLAYNAEKQLESETDAAGRKLTLKYNSEHEVESATDPMGHTVNYTYEGGNLASVTLPGEEHPRWRYKYSSSHELTSATNGREHTTTIEYNEAHQVSAETDALSRKRAWEYATSEGLAETRITEPNGSTTIEKFNEFGSPISVTRASGTAIASTTSYEYNAGDELKAVVDPNKHVTEYGYDAAGDRISETNPDDDETKWEYDSSHDVTGITRPGGEKTTIERDSHGNALAISRQAPREAVEVSRYEYDGHGDLTHVEDPLKHVWTYEYDGAGDRVAEVAPGGARTTWGYNEDGEVISKTMARGNEEGAEAAKFTTDYERDAQGRVIAVRQASVLGGRRPAVRELPSVSGLPQEGQTLTAGTGVWEGAPSLSYSYRWEACNLAGEECFAMPGATEATLRLESSLLGYLMRVAVTASNAFGSRTAISAMTRVVSLSAPPVFVSSFGSEGGGSGEFYRPTGVAVDASGDVWVADGYGSKVEKFSSSGSWLASYGSFGSEEGEFDEPVGVAINRSTGDIYVADQNNNRVVELSEEGHWVRSWTGGEGEFHEPNGIAVDAKGNVWVTDYGDDRVEEFDGEGHFERQFGTVGSGPGEFYGPSGVVVANGLVYVTDLNNARLEGFDEEGDYEGEVGGWGFGVGGFMYPGGLAADASGNIYVADIGNDRIQQLEEYGSFRSFFGTAGHGPGQMEEPEDVAIAPSGAIYVTDSGNNRVEQWAPAGKPDEETPVSVNGQVLDGQTLTAGTGVWTAAPAPSYAYQWERCNRAGTECSAISGATGSTYTLGEADEGKTIRVQVTASNEHGEAASTSAITGEVPAARTTKYTYDPDGNVSTVTDSEGDETKYTYDADDEPTKVEDPDGATTETGYNEDGEVIAQTDGNKHTTEYKRNLLGEVTEAIDPDGRKTTREYDAAGNLTSVTDPLKLTTSYKYDAANRLTEITYSDGKTPSVKYEYNEDGDRTKMVDGTGTTTYTYDQLDRLTEVEDGNRETVAYEYNLDDQPVKITYPNGKSTSRAYNENGQLETVTDWKENTTKFTYNADGYLTNIEYPTSSKDHDTITYNEADEPTETTFTKESETLASIGYTHNPDGLIDTETTEDLPGEPTTNYQYDPSDRLTTAGPTSYNYDAANNLTTQGTGEYTYDHADQLETSPGASYTYNEAGQRTKTKPTSGPATTYEYDQADNLLAVNQPHEGSTPAIEDTYTYNGNGLRTSETIASSTSHLTWDESEPLPTLLSNGTYSFIYGPNQNPVEQINNTTGSVLYLHHDQAGSTRLITGSTGKVEGKCSYSAYGTPTCEGSATTPLGWDAQYTSPDTGLIYLRARTYDPATAQFLTVDPAVALTREPYAYGGDNPVNRRDPDGLSAEGLEGVPCYFPFCGPPPPAVEGVQHGLETVEHGIENVWNEVNENEGPNDEGEASLRKRQAEAEDACDPTPPGYDPETWTKGPASRLKEPGDNYYDPDGGEWHWHPPDRWHEGHWDYKPGEPWNAEWEKVFP